MEPRIVRELQAHADLVSISSHASPRMARLSPSRPRVALFFTRVPWPLDRGDHIRNTQVLQACASRADVTVFALTDRPLEPVPEPLRASGARFVIVPHPAWASWIAMAAALPGSSPLQVAYFVSRAMRRAIAKNIDAGGEFDLGIASFLRMWPYVQHTSIRRQVADFHDSMSMRSTRAAAFAPWAARPVLREEGRRMAALESRVAREAHECWIISEADRREVLDRTPGGHIEVVPNGIETRWGDSGLADSSTRQSDVCFLGNMTVSHNRDAAILLARAIWPEVRARHSAARLRLVGTHDGAVAALANLPGVTVEGYVEDLAPVLRASRLAVAPLRFATGLQNKVIETMSAGLPSVVTRVVNEGIGAPEGEAILIADSAEEQVEAIVALLDDPGRARAMGERARAWVRGRYTWDVLERRIERLIER